MTELRPEDLRINSWYHSVKWNKPVQLTAEDIYNLVANSEGANISSYISSMFTPIPLSEDWLKRFGFYKERTGDRLTIEAWSPGHPSQRFNIDFKDGKILLISRYQGESDSLTMIHIESIHHLQNLFPSLTGAELKAGK